MPIFCIVALKICLSSPFFIASGFAPRNFTSFKRPLSKTSIAAFRATCPPIVGKIASIFSFSMIFKMLSFVIGSIYVASAKFGSVMIVAGFELISTTRYPSSFSVLAACVPE